jgi:hypothetical protein
MLAAAALTLAGCGGSASPAASLTSAASSTPASSPSASSASPSTGQPAQAPPAGYKWIGIAAQQIWLAVPESWVVINLNDMSVTQALERVQLRGLPASTMRTAIEGLKRNHALMAMDASSIAASPGKFATNLNAYCMTSPIQPGPGVASAIASNAKAEYTQLGGHVVTVRNLSDSTSSVVVKIQVNLQSAAGQTVHELQYIDLTSQNRICYTTFSTDRPAVFFPLFAKIAATIQAG